jgi:hypothetical protein
MFTGSGHATAYLPHEGRPEDQVIHNNITGNTHTGWPRRFAKAPGLASLLRRGSHKTKNVEGTVGGLYSGGFINSHLNVQKKQIGPGKIEVNSIPTTHPTLKSEASSPHP